MKKIFVLVILWFSFSACAQNKYDFAIYSDTGAWQDGIIAFEQFLDWKGFSHNRVNAQYINTHNLQNNYKGIYFPGGDADYYNRFINLRGAMHIQQLVNNNGYYIGMCAGADYACDKLIWEGVTYDYPLNLFQGTTIGPIDQIAPWPNYTMTSINMNSNDVINQFGNTSEDMLYWGGATFEPSSLTNYDIVATYNDYNNQPAIIKFSYGTGRVLLIGPHPEIEENSNRDHTTVANELNDNGSDWNFLWTATDWLTKRTISTPINNSEVQIFPNPTTKILYIKISKKIERITVLNMEGKVVKSYKTQSKYVNVSDLSKGTYIIDIFIYNKKYSNQLIIE